MVGNFFDWSCVIDFVFIGFDWDNVLLSFVEFVVDVFNDCF